MAGNRALHLLSLSLIPSLLLLAPVIANAASAPNVQAEVACPSCDDRNPCTVDTCDTSTGTCRHDPLDCNDGNVCTTDGCLIVSPTSGFCTHVAVANGTACDDQNSCTTSDACATIQGDGSQCVGQIQPAGTGCDDGNSCTSSDTCDGNGQCLGTPASPGSSCDDGSLCTSGETCVTLPTGALACRGTPVDCSDSNLCTQDLCNPATGQCSHPPINCDDGNTCTADSCDPATGACLRTNQPGACSFIDQCITGLSCSGGNCVGGTPNSCDDGISCTADSCQWNTGCAHTPQNSLCGSNNACAFWLCLPQQGGCFNTVQQGPQECDGNPCTNDECIQNSCHVVSANTNPCNDGNPCTIDDRCSLTQCRGTPLNCDDGIPCTADSCSAGSCVHTAACDDGNVCTTDACDAATGACQHTNNTDPCSDPNTCTTGGVCADGVCQGGTPLNCDDGNPCTNDQCQAGGTCGHFFNTNPCDDHNACTLNDRCNAGSCTGGSARNCNDFNACTDDACDPASGCTHANNTGSCSDGNACTVGDQCGGGVCHAGTLLNCDDNNVCTDDSCSLSGGCIHQPRSSQETCGVGACRRTVDTCVDGVPHPCVPGTPTAEVCNGVDDDCDGLVDEDGIRADCVVSPSTLNLSSQGGSVSMTCRLYNVCDPANPVPISGSTASIVYVSALDRADDPGDDRRLPDPSTLPCPDPVLGTLYERGISENFADRSVSNANVTFKFNLPSDGDCSTLDGDRADIAALSTAIPDNTTARICIAGRVEGMDYQSCMQMLVKNKGLR